MPSNAKAQDPNGPDGEVRRGRSALTNPSGRFETLNRVAFGPDGYGPDGLSPDEQGPAPQTVLRAEKVRSILSHNDSPDVGFSQSINPYRGCEHGCIYCYARPSHGYIGLSAGLDFETKIFHKSNAPEVLVSQLNKPKYRPQVTVIGANTDPYQPAERQLKLTRRLLEIHWQYRHPVSLITKSALVLRDLDVLAKLAAHKLTSVCISITSLRSDLSSTMEPRASSPHRRLEAIRQLEANGIPVQVLVAPVIPALSDPELESILESVAQAGAKRANYILLRLPHEVKDLFRDWLKVHFPLQAERVMHLQKQMRGGRENDPNFGTRMSGTGLYADVLRRRFELSVRRLGLNRVTYPLTTELFRVPGRAVQQVLPFAKP